jgi:hypothetical protein
VGVWEVERAWAEAVRLAPANGYWVGSWAKSIVMTVSGARTQCTNQGHSTGLEAEGGGGGETETERALGELRRALQLAPGNLEV